MSSKCSVINDELNKSIFVDIAKNRMSGREGPATARLQDMAKYPTICQVFESVCKLL